jgi:hypothetical protein
MSEEKEQPYLYTQRIVTDRHYNAAYGDDRHCECGHVYYRHFDSYEDNEPVGCKYCPCDTFVEGVSQVGTTCVVEGCTGILETEAGRRNRAEDLVCSVCRKQHHGFQRGLNHPDWLDEWRAKNP